jgi:hypothetical protein
MFLLIMQAAAKINFEMNNLSIDHRYLDILTLTLLAVVYCFIFFLYASITKINCFTRWALLLSLVSMYRRQ